MRRFIAALPFTVGLLITSVSINCWAEVEVCIQRNGSESSTPVFQFPGVPAPMENDAAAKAVFEIVDGQRDRNGGALAALNDGKAPTEEDQPSANFFFRPASEGGRILIDLGRTVDISRIGTYSWHPDNRAPQVYRLYGAASETTGLNTQPHRPVLPETCGWRLVAEVDTRPKTDYVGGQIGVSITNSNGLLGSFRFLLLDISPTRAGDYFAQTFFSEIDVVDANAKEMAKYLSAPKRGAGIDVIQSADGIYKFTIDTSDTPEIRAWVQKEIFPITTNWYPKLVEMMASDGYQAPRSVHIRFDAEMDGVAHTAGARITCAAKWFKQNLEGEARGAVFHELVHVVQQYGHARRSNPNPRQSPGWLVEGFADYLRWYYFEPESKGAEIPPRAASRARYDASYRPSANFLNWVITKYDRSLTQKLNTAMREGLYTEEIWKEATGKTLPELGADWKEHLSEAKPGA